jgi:exodeoxyribonuclease-5
MLHTLEGEQVPAYEHACAFVERCMDKTDKQVYQIDGLAGSGKSEIVAHLVNTYHLPVLTYTGKAADVLRRERGVDAQTMHSFLYGLPELERHLRCENEKCGTDVEQRLESRLCQETIKTAFGPQTRSAYKYRVVRGEQSCPVCHSDLVQVRHDIPHFRHKRVAPGEKAGMVAVIDESSMVGPTIANELLNTGVNLVVFGDPGQLPPVQEPRFFTNPAIFIKQPHRFAKESGIYRQAHAVRDGHMYANDAEFSIASGKIDKQAVIDADARICWKNKTRYQLTQMMRDWLGYGKRPPQKGEPMLCLRNKRTARYEVYNGQIYRLARNYDPAWDSTMEVIDELTNQQFSIPNVCIDTGAPGQIVSPEGNFFYYGYVLTAHKAQGSGWNNVIIFDEMENTRRDRACWVYTAITRSKLSTLMVPFGGGPTT